MKVLHLNTHSSGGSYEYAALLSNALAEQGIDSRRALQKVAVSTGRQTSPRSRYSPIVCFLIH